MRKANTWVVIEGVPVFTCRTRKQAREYVRKHKKDRPVFSYVGKCAKNYRQIILDT